MSDEDDGYYDDGGYDDGGYDDGGYNEGYDDGSYGDVQSDGCQEQDARSDGGYADEHSGRYQEEHPGSDSDYDHSGGGYSGSEIYEESNEVHLPQSQNRNSMAWLTCLQHNHHESYSQGGVHQSQNESSKPSLDLEFSCR